MADQSRLNRLFRLIETLGMGKPQNASMLAEMCNVSRRTVFRDITTLQESGIHVQYDAEKQGYFLSRPTYMRPADLTLEETLSLIVMGVELGNSRSGLMFCDHARQAAMKLACNLPDRLREAVGQVTESVLIDVGSNQATDLDRVHFDVLRSAISERRCIRIRYDSLFEGEEIGTRVSPYRILFARREWYMIGRSSLHRSVRTFKVRRILSAELLDEKYTIPSRFSMDRYFGNAWHLIRDQAHPAHVVVHFRPLVAQNVAEVQWHKTQRFVWLEDGSLEMHVDVEGLSEISWWLMGYGDQAEVIEPAALRNLLAARVRGLMEIYESELDEESDGSRKRSLKPHRKEGGKKKGQRRDQPKP